MANTFTLEIVSPTGVLFSGDVETVTAPGIKGEFGVLEGHTEYLAILNPGEVMYRQGGKDISLVVSSGYSEVGPRKTSILVESATLTSEIDISQAKNDLKAYETALGGMTPEDPAYRETAERRDLATAKIDVAEKRKGR